MQCRRCHSFEFSSSRRTLPEQVWQRAVPLGSSRCRSCGHRQYSVAYGQMLLLLLLLVAAGLWFSRYANTPLNKTRLLHAQSNTEVTKAARVPSRTGLLAGYSPNSSPVKAAGSDFDVRQVESIEPAIARSLAASLSLSTTLSSDIAAPGESEPAFSNF